MSETPGSRG